MTAETKKPKWGPVNFKQIEKRREELGLAKSAMANRLGVTNSTFHNWQRGTTVPHPSQQEQIKTLLETMTAPEPGASPGTRTARVSTREPNLAATPRAKRTALPERSRGARENGAGGEHLMHGGFTAAHPFFLAPGQSVPGNDLPGIATITAAFISSQDGPPSAGSVYEFIHGLKKALAPEVPVEKVVETPAPVAETVAEPVT